MTEPALESSARDVGALAWMTPRQEQNRPAGLQQTGYAERMTARVNRHMLTQIDPLLDEYWDALMETALADKSIEDYWYFAYCFCRWMKGEFTPGQGRQMGTSRSAHDLT